MKNVLNSLAKSVLIPLGLTEAPWATGARVYKKAVDSETATLKVWNE